MFTPFNYLSNPLRNLVLIAGLDSLEPRTEPVVRQRVIDFLDMSKSQPSRDRFRYVLEDLVESGIAEKIIEENPDIGRDAPWYTISDKRYQMAARIVSKWTAKNRTNICDILTSKKGRVKNGSYAEARINVLVSIYQTHNVEQTGTDLRKIVGMDKFSSHYNLKALVESGLVIKPTKKCIYSIDLSRFRKKYNNSQTASDSVQNRMIELVQGETLTKEELTGFSVYDIIDQLGYTRASVRRFMSKLVSEGIAEKQCNPRQRAHKVYTLSPKGISFVEDSIHPVYFIFNGAEAKREEIIRDAPWKYSFTKQEMQTLRYHVRIS